MEPRKYDPETDVRICLLMPNSDGQIRSRSLHGGARYVQHSAACDDQARLQGIPAPNQRISRQFSDDPRAVNCPACQATEHFQERFAEQFPQTYTVTSTTTEPPSTTTLPPENPESTTTTLPPQ